MLKGIKQNKKLILTITLLLFIPIIMPIIEIILRCLLNLGRLVGTNMRFVDQGICFK